MREFEGLIWYVDYDEMSSGKFSHYKTTHISVEKIDIMWLLYNFFSLKYEVSQRTSVSTTNVEQTYSI